MTGEPERAPADLRAFAEVLVDVLAERGVLVAAQATPQARVLDATQVGEMLGRDRQWVYAHADELGAFRFGDGPRARLGFDHARVEAWKRERQACRTPSTIRKSSRRAAAAPAGQRRVKPVRAYAWRNRDSTSR